MAQLFLGGSIEWKSLLNFTYYIIKFHNCHHINLADEVLNMTNSTNIQKSLGPNSSNNKRLERLANMFSNKKSNEDNSSNSKKSKGPRSLKNKSIIENESDNDDSSDMENTINEKSNYKRSLKQVIVSQSDVNQKCLLCKFGTT